MVHKIFCYTNHYNICVCCIGTIKRAPFQQKRSVLSVYCYKAHTHICSSFRENPPVHSRTNAHSRSYTDTHAEPWYRFMCTPLALGAHSADKFALYALGDIDWSNHTTQKEKRAKWIKKRPEWVKERINSIILPNVCLRARVRRVASRRCFCPLPNTYYLLCICNMISHFILAIISFLRQRTLLILLPLLLLLILGRFDVL